MSEWTLIATCKAEDKTAATMKFVDKLPYLLVNDYKADGSVEVEIVEVVRK